jgi:hypothetical protein
MTIRRDWPNWMRKNASTARMAAPHPAWESLQTEDGLPDFQGKTETVQVDGVDVLVMTSVNPYYDKLCWTGWAKNIPIIAESLAMPNQRTVVSVDNYQAGLDLGRAAGRYMRLAGFEKAYLLDLTFQLSNTQTRSQGFIDGLSEAFPACEVVLSINAQSRAATAHQITCDALTVHEEINLIFAINDSTALGAIAPARICISTRQRWFWSPSAWKGIPSAMPRWRTATVRSVWPCFPKSSAWPVSMLPSAPVWAILFPASTSLPMSC